MYRSADAGVLEDVALGEQIKMGVRAAVRASVERSIDANVFTLHLVHLPNVFMLRKAFRTHCGDVRKAVRRRRDLKSVLVSRPCGAFLSIRA